MRIRKFINPVAKISFVASVSKFSSRPFVKARCIIVILKLNLTCLHNFCSALSDKKASNTCTVHTHVGVDGLRAWVFFFEVIT